MTVKIHIQFGKLRLHNSVITELFDKPLSQIEALKIVAIRKAAELEFKEFYSETTPYLTYVNGKEEATTELMWVTTEVTPTDELITRLSKLQGMADTLANDYNQISNYITELLNHSQTQLDVYKLFPDVLHHLLIELDSNVNEEADSNFTDLAKEYHSIATSAPGYALVKQRILRNLLIKNL